MPSATAGFPDLTPYFKLDGSRTITGATIITNTLNVSGLLTGGAGAAFTGSLSATEDITARSLATTRTLTAFSTSYAYDATITSTAAAASSDLSGLLATVKHTGAGLLSFIEGLQVYTETTGPTTEHYGLYLSAANKAATSRFFGLRLGATSSAGAAISTDFVGAYIRAQLAGGSTAPVLIGLDVELAGAGSTTTYGIRTNGNIMLAGAQKLIGGTSTTAGLTLQTTTGVGGASSIFKVLVGNNGATEAITILSNGDVGIKTPAPNNALDITGTVQADGLRLDVTPTAETIVPTHTITISVSGTNYKIPLVLA